MASFTLRLPNAFLTDTCAVLPKAPYMSRKAHVAITIFVIKSSLDNFSELILIFCSYIVVYNFLHLF